MSVGSDATKDLVRRATQLQRALRDTNLDPHTRKQIEKRYSLKEAERLVGRSSQAIRDAEMRGHAPKGPVPKPDLGPNNRRLGFTLQQINELREAFGTRLHRGADEDPVIVAVQNFKGGVAKTTTAVHLAQYLAREGYRVLLVDCDPQASATTTFGYLPDVDIPVEKTLLPYFTGEKATLDYAITPVEYWDGLDFIPANLQTYTAEYTFIGEDYEPEMLLILREGLQTVSDRYDVVVLDPAPALGFLSLNVLNAANALIVPVPPGRYDLASTSAFLTMLHEALKTLEERLEMSEYKFVKLLITKFEENSSADIANVTNLQAAFGHSLMTAKMKTSTEVKNAGNHLKTVYELSEPVTLPKVHRRALTLFDAVNHEIELLIRETWPSHAADLRAKGLA